MTSCGTVQVAPTGEMARDVQHNETTMPVRRRNDPCARDGAPRWRVNASLVVLTALVVARQWGGVESFVVGTAGGVVDPQAAAGSNAAAARPPARSRRSVGRCRRGVVGGARRLGLALSASLRDEDEFDTDAWTDRILDKDDDEDADLGMGVSKTINKKRTPDPKYVNAEAMDNAILDLATATQSVLDKLEGDDAEMEAERKQQAEAEAAAAAEAADANDPDGDDDLGMGVSETVPPPKSMLESMGEEGLGDRLQKVISTVQGADQIREMESMTARDQKRAEMKQRGLSPEQIAAYMGDASSAKAPMSSAEEAKAKKEAAAARSIEKFRQVAFVESSAWRREQDLLKVAPSSTLVKTDENGEPVLDRFVYVDEYTCIGCTHCNHEAPSTFFMEEDYGRARVYQQGRDTDEAVRTAIETCPVDCIHYVDWPELVRLEKEREGIDINFKAKLVGNDHDNVVNGMQIISSNQSMRCENCPTKGCYNCPMFGVGNNPAYTQRKAERKAKRVAQRKKERKERTGGTKTADL